MKSLCRKYLKILQVEIEDLQDDLNLFLEVLQDRHLRHLVTDYVYNENSATLRNEILGLRECVRALENYEAAPCSSIEQVRDDLKKEIFRRLDEHGYVPAVRALVGKKLDKIAVYLKLGESTAAVPG